MQPVEHQWLQIELICSLLIQPYTLLIKKALVGWLLRTMVFNLLLLVLILNEKIVASLRHLLLDGEA